MVHRVPCLAALSTLLLLLAACEVPQPSTPIPSPEYLVEDIPPCMPVAGSSVDPCEPDVDQYTESMGGAASGPEPESPTGMRDVLNRDRGSIAHIVLRGTYLPGTVRCTYGNPFRPPSYMRYEEYDLLEHTHSIDCFVDVRVGSYILGAGPSTLTVQRFWFTYWPGDYISIAAEEGKSEQEYLENLKQQFESDEGLGGIAGREEILFLGPSGDASVEVWHIIGASWDVQRREDDTVIAVHPGRDYWRDDRPDEYQMHLSALEMDLPAFTQAVTTAHQARLTEYGGRIGPESDLPMLLTNANQIRQYYTAVGAYNHPDGPPVQPPPPCGLSVPNRADNTGLMADCQTLLALKDALRGTATLNWSVDTVITSWDGVTTDGTPSRVTELDLSSESLTGSIPGELGTLLELTSLDLSSNSLTGEIPRELGRLSNLTEARLSGNSLTGCIPIGLKEVATTDFSALSLLFCPPVPEGLSAGTPAENSIPLSWSPVAGTSKYRVEYIDTVSDSWIVDNDAITGTTHTAEGLYCARLHLLQVSAYGDGTNYATEWSHPLGAVVAETTGMCVDPVFGFLSYAFAVSDDAEVGVSVGTVSATIAGGDAVSYSIYLKNEDERFVVDERFAIDSGTGEITLADALDYAATSSYTLRVEATVERRGWTFVEVAVTVLPP